MKLGIVVFKYTTMKGVATEREREYTYFDA